MAIGLRGSTRRIEPWVAFGRLGRRLGPRPPLAVPGWSGDSISLAANTRGDVAVAAIGCTRPTCANRRLYLLYRPRGGRFGRPLRVADGLMDQGESGGGLSPDVAVNSAGDVLVAWGQWGPGSSRGLWVRHRRDGRWRGRAQRVSGLRESSRVKVALGGRRSAVVAWWTQHSDPGGAGSGPLAPPRFSVAVAGRNGRFGPGTQFDAGALGPPPGTGAPAPILPSDPNLFATIEPSGLVRLAWTGADVGGEVARAATFSSGTAVSAQTLGRGRLIEFAPDGHGRAVALCGEQSSVFASIAFAGHPFTHVPEPVDTEQPVVSAPGAVAFDPRTGRVTAVWVTGSRPGFAPAETWRPRDATRDRLTA